MAWILFCCKKQLNWSRWKKKAPWHTHTYIHTQEHAHRDNSQIHARTHTHPSTPSHVVVHHFTLRLHVTQDGISFVITVKHSSWFPLNERPSTQLQPLIYRQVQSLQPAPTGGMFNQTFLLTFIIYLFYFVLLLGIDERARQTFQKAHTRTYTHK